MTESAALLRAKACHIEWKDDDAGRVERVWIFERVFDDRGQIVLPAGLLDRHGRFPGDNSHGACVMGWMTSDEPRSTPEGVFAGMVAGGFASEIAHLQALREFGRMDSCGWARTMAEAMRRRLLNEDKISEEDWSRQVFADRDPEDVGEAWEGPFETCSDCLHWRPLNRRLDKGRCQFAPPVVLMFEDGAGTRWPETAPDDHCSHFAEGVAPNYPDWSAPAVPLDEEPF